MITSYCYSLLVSLGIPTYFEIEITLKFVVSGLTYETTYLSNTVLTSSNYTQIWNICGLRCQVGTKNSKLLLGTIYRSQRMMANQQWLETIESLLTDIITTWDGLLILMGDTNIDLMKVSDSVTKSYDILQSCNLQQHITKPTIITQSSKTLIDHVISNKPHCVSYSDVLPCPSVSDHDASYACLNVHISRFQPRYKIIRREKDVDMVAYYNDFSSIPFSVIYAFSDPEEMLASFNTLIKDCINRHAPIKRVKVTRPPCPWLKTNNIQALQVK